MFLSKMDQFRKSAECPASEELLAYQKGELPPRDSIDVHRHIIDCEFCESEVEMYLKCPQTEDECFHSAEEIPPALYELAEAILEKRYADYSLLNQLLSESEKLTKF